MWINDFGCSIFSYASLCHCVITLNFPDDSLFKIDLVIFEIIHSKQTKKHHHQITFRIYNISIDYLFLVVQNTIELCKRRRYSTKL